MTSRLSPGLKIAHTGVGEAVSSRSLLTLFTGNIFRLQAFELFVHWGHVTLCQIALTTCYLNVPMLTWCIM